MIFFDRHYPYTELFRYLRTVVNGLEERNDPTDSDGRNFYCLFVFFAHDLFPTKISLLHTIYYIYMLYAVRFCTSV